MEKKLTFLGIETSCDETAASIVQENNDGRLKYYPLLFLVKLKNMKNLEVLFLN